MTMGFDTRKLDLVGKSVRSLTVRYYTVPYGAYDADFTLPRKTSKEKDWEPYHKPTQVDEDNIQRRSSESSLRNSANWLRNFGRRSAHASGPQ